MTKINLALDFISKLPPEVFQLILLNLSLKDLRTCERVSRFFLQKVRDEALWKEKINKYHINWEKEQGSARLAVLRFFRPKPMPKPARETPTTYFSITLREDFMI